MRTKIIQNQTLKELIIRKNVVTMVELKDFLKTNANMTVFRRLRELSYLSSCSHKGKYYSLNEIAQFNESGLWIYNSIIFSIYGNLMATCEHFVNGSECGYSAMGLKQIIGLDVKEPLLKLYRQSKIVRSQIGRHLIYFGSDPSKKRSQLILRKKQLSSRTLNIGKIYSNVITDELQAAIILFYSILDERQRRLYAGLESLKLGYGGDSLIAEFLKIDSHTVGKGRKELIDKNLDFPITIRKKGGGRKSIKKNA